MRRSLSSGEKIELTCGQEQKMFYIDAELGAGASSVVYEAHSFDQNQCRHNVRIKECFPHMSVAERKEQSLVWKDEETKQNYLQSFYEAHYRLLDIQSQGSLGNQMVHVMGLYEGNNTLYSVMNVDFGQTFAHYTDKSLHDILNTVLVLTKTLGHLHENGYLHLDLKPDNFLVSYEPTLMLRLFDVDSLVKRSDIKGNRVSVLPCSEGWAAPEQVQGKRKCIGPATDIYSLGAILFYKIMGRMVDIDDIGLFAKWEFEGDLFKDVDPKIKRILSNIFRKTLAASSKYRYQSTKELERVLQEAVDITAEGKPFLKSNYAVSTAHFIGREQELRHIQNAFSSGARCVLLHGIGGIGKSELAKKYSERYRSEYDVMLFCRYDGSLKNLLENIEIQNFSGDKCEHRKYLRRLFNERTLLIIDNFDVAVDEDDYLDELFCLNAHILVTTRTDFSQLLNNSVRQVEVEELSIGALERLFMVHSGKEILSLDEYALLKQIISMVGGLTYAVELVGRQIRISEISLLSLCERLRNAGLESFEHMEKISVNKDNQIRKGTVLNLFRALNRVSALTEDAKQVLKNVYLLQFHHVEKKTYKQMTLANVREMDAFNDLIERGWVQEERLYFHTGDHIVHYTLHAIAQELIRVDLVPTVENSKSLGENMLCYLPTDVSFSSDSGPLAAAEEAEAMYRYNVLCQFSNGLDLKHPSNIEYVLTWVQKFWLKENEDDEDDLGFVFWCSSNNTLKLLQRLEDAVEKNAEQIGLRYAVYVSLFKWWLVQCSLILGDSEESRTFHEERETNVIKYYNLCIQSAGNERSTGAEDQIAYKIISSALQERPGLEMTIPKEVLLDAFSRSPDAFRDIPEFIKCEYGLPMTQEDIAFTEWYSQFSFQESECEAEQTEEDRFEEQRSRFSEEFLESENPWSFIKEHILSDESLSEFRKVLIIESCVDRIFFSARHGAPCDFSDICFEDISNILDEQERLVLSKTYDDSEQEKWETQFVFSDIYVSNIINQIILYAAHGYEKVVNLYWDELLKAVEATMESFTKSDDLSIHIALQRINEAPIALYATKNARYAVYFLERFTELWEEKLVSEKGWPQETAYTAYNNVATFACAAADKPGVEDAKRQEFFRTAEKYRRKADDAIGKNIIFREE